MTSREIRALKALLRHSGWQVLLGQLQNRKETVLQEWSNASYASQEEEVSSAVKAKARVQEISFLEVLPRAILEQLGELEEEEEVYGSGEEQPDS